MNKCTERVYNGIIKENPVFILMLGMCPTLAVTTSAMNGLGMGLSTTVVLLMSNIIISVLRNIIPDRVRIPAFIVIVASLVTVVQLLMQAYIPFLYNSLGIYIPLIVVNCIILGRAESYASKNKPVLSGFDGLGMGIGFAFALTCIGAVRELLGTGTISILDIPLREVFKVQSIMPETYEPIGIFILSPGAFFVVSILTALQNKFQALSATNRSGRKSKLACGGECVSCSGSSCMSNHDILETRQRQAEEKTLEAKKVEVADKEADLKANTGKKEE